MPGIEDFDGRDVPMPASQFDELIVQGARTSAAVDQIKRNAFGLWALVVLCLLIGWVVAKFYSDWQVQATIGTPALERMKQDLTVQIQSVRQVGDGRQDTLQQILAGQSTTNALLTQRIDQAEKRLQRLEDHAKT